jgi:DHA1 family tetracycline resistance protein-like MFS transporter
MNRQLFIILVIVFLGFLGISMPYLIFPALFLNPDYAILPSEWSAATHSLLLGVTLAAYPLGQFIGSPVLGALSDTYGRKRLLSMSLLLAGLCNLMTGVALAWQAIGFVILSRFVAGLMEGNIAIARAMATDIKSMSKHETFGKISAAASIAFLLGPLLGGLLADKQLIEDVTISTPFYLIGVIFIAVSLFSAFSLQEDHKVIVRGKVNLWSRFNIWKRLSVLFQNKQLRFLMITSTLFTLAVDIFYEFGPVYLTDKWMLGPIQLVSYNTVLCISLALGNGMLAARYSRRYSIRRGIIGFLGLFAFLMAAMVLEIGPHIMLAIFALCGFAIGIAFTLITVQLSDSAPDTIQGEVMGVQMSLRVLGDAVICIVGGALLLLSAKIILVIAASISLVAMIYFASRE